MSHRKKEDGKKLWEDRDGWRGLVVRQLSWSGNMWEDEVSLYHETKL